MRAKRGRNWAWSLLMCVGVLVALAVAVSPASAVCQSTGKSCGFNAPSNDRLCCPGTVCGWGNVCQAGCRINGTLYQSGAKNPGNACQSCQPGVSTTRWSNARAGTACGDPSSGACDNADTCDGSGACQDNHVAGGCCAADDACNDQNPCTIDTCNLATHSCVNTTKTCTASDLCHRASCAPGDGSCVEAPIDCEDGDACTDDSCNPATGACGHPTVGCEDGDACTADSCDATTGCTHTPIAGCGTCAPPGTIDTTFCSSSSADCNLNVGRTCCSGMSASVAQPCPLFPGFNAACACL